MPRKKPDPFWARIRKDFRAGKLKWGYGRSSIPGVVTIEALHEDCGVPLGTVWFRWHNPSTLSIEFSFVRPGVRRCGVRTFLHKRLLADYPTISKITTADGTRHGRQWLLATGFTRGRDGSWTYRRRRR